MPIFFRFPVLATSGVLLLCLSCAREACRTLSQARPEGEREPKPRCAPTDPSCGPMPLHGSEAVCYRPSQTRERLPASKDGEANSVLPVPECAHDGECNVNGCGNLCTSFRAGPMESNCIGYDWLDEAQFCGCIQGECAFFKQ